MPHAIAASLTHTFVQVLALTVLLAAGMACSRAASLRFLATFPDDVPEKSELLRGAGHWWWVLNLPVSMVVFYVIFMLLFAPLSGIVVAALIVLAPLVWFILAHDNAALDAPFAAFEGLRARLQRREPDPQRWLAQYRRQAARRRSLSVLGYLMLVLVLLLAIVGAYGYVAFDRVIASRVRSMAIAERVQQQMGPVAGTIFARTPPCVKEPTLYLVPPPNVTPQAVEASKQQAVKSLAQLDPEHRWQVVIRTGEPPAPTAKMP